MKAVAAANLGSPSLFSASPTQPGSGGVLLCNTTALITKSDGVEAVDTYSGLERNVKYFVCMCVETDDYIFLERF